MSTQLELINDVLIRLREDEVSTVNENAYSTLVAQFINDAIDDANNAWFWSIYRTEITVPLVIATESYDLTTTNDRSFVVRHRGKDLPLAYDTTDTANFQLCLLTEAERYDYRAQRDFNVTKEKPEAFSVTLDPTGRFYQLNLLQTPEEARTWTVWWYVPQHDLATRTNADASTEIKLQRNFILLRALFYALEERGEVLGPREGSQQWIRSMDALGAMIEIDQQLQRRMEEYDLTNEETLVRRGDFPILSVS